MVFVMTASLSADTLAPDAAGADLRVDLYDPLARSDCYREMLTVLRLLVAAGDDVATRKRHVDAHLASPNDLPPVRTISGVAQDRPGRPRQPQDEWLNLPGTGPTITAVTAADTHPNIVVRSEAASTVPAQLLRWWATGRHECVVIDIDGRYAQFDLPAPAGRHVDVADVSADQLRAVLRTHHGVSFLDFSHVPAASRSTALSRALSVVAAHRARTGPRHWMMIDDAETVLSDPDIPPHVLDLSQRGYCLVMRSPEELPDSLVPSIDVIAGTAGSGGD
jgi:hypothetical protein